MVLMVPDNPILDGVSAVIESLTWWGAHVKTSVGSGKFRALHSEMVPGAKGVAQPLPEKKPSPREQGYTGDPCPTCGSIRMKRSGACSVCEDCGTSNGCS